ncbi:glycosyltransferase family 2 protein [Candidatus Puniceispirillum marinum]|uniref:Glycosyl transferase family 2 n=1 Tax=Puniceispirillum marinum (strain IMCC1322) TaxID=488538 RepID=D5BN07_PUNMI|nr:glycosyltransferase family A protein [Candidatus Puniceispirillum marinum]ADE40200.1 glycosyl transferase family 2 [Candidatus Puniceispirillum marinum IMCC1322]
MIFTVFTPTYNRAHSLHRVYNSLCNQTFTDFEWVIVDDGSSDNTKQLIDGWITEGQCSIRYEFQPNKGKHVAINHGVGLAKGDLFLIADSDDGFPANALEILYEHWCAIPEKQRAEFTGVTGLCADEQGQIIGDKFPDSVFDSNSADIYYRYGIRGEKWGFHRTDVMKAFPFPEPEDVRFVPEGLIWNAIGRQYKTRFVNDIVRDYYQGADDQLTKRSSANISSVRIFNAQMLDADIDYFLHAPWTICKIGIQGARFSFHQNDSFIMQITRLSHWGARLIWITVMPIGFGLYFFDPKRVANPND